MLNGEQIDVLKHRAAMIEETASVKWKASQKKCLYASWQGVKNGMHAEVPFSQVIQQGELESASPVLDINADHINIIKKFIY